MREAWRREFEPEREFTVRKAMTVAGRHFARGEDFDPKLVPVRKLRQLFDQHRIFFKGTTPGKLIRNHRFEPDSPTMLAHAPLETPAADEAPAGPTAEEIEAERAQAEEEARLVAEKAQAEKVAGRRAVAIPKGWVGLKWNDKRTLACSLTDEPIRDKGTAERVIAEELALRGNS